MNKKDNAAIKNSVKNKRKEAENNRKALTRKTKEEIGNMEEIEDTTKYGEFVSSYFAWLTLEKQKQNVEHMENITYKNKK